MRRGYHVQQNRWRRLPAPVKLQPYDSIEIWLLIYLFIYYENRSVNMLLLLFFPSALWDRWFGDKKRIQ